MLEVSPHRIGRSEARVSERAEEESSESSDPVFPPPNNRVITRGLGLSLSDPFSTTIQARWHWQRPD